MSKNQTESDSSVITPWGSRKLDRAILPVWLPIVLVGLVIGLAVVLRVTGLGASRSELEVGTPIPVGQEPLGLAVSSDGSRLFVVNAADHTLNAVALTGASSGSVNGTVKLGEERLNSVAVAPDGKTLFVTEVEKGRVYRLEHQNNGDEAPDRLEVNGFAEVGEFPQGVIVSGDGQRVYTADTGSNTVTDVNPNTLERRGSIGVSERPHSLAFGADGKLYVSTFVHTVDVIDPSTGRTLAPLDLGELARFQGLEVSRDGRVYVADGLTDLVQQFDANGQASRVDLGAVPQGKEFSPTDVALSADGSRLYVVGRGGYLSVIDPRSNRAMQLLELGGDLRQVVVAPDGTVYATDFSGNRVVVAKPTGRSAN